MYKTYFKRILDLIMSIIAIPFLIPIMMIIGIVILIQDGTPIIFKQDRIGKDGRLFKIYKFRTMINNAEKLGPLATSPGDKRLTKIGAKLRKLSLDELPQIFNVLLGNMSIIGPRPDVYINYDNLTSEEKLRTSVRPGITGLAQVNGRSSLTKEQRMEYDLNYVKNCSFKLDINILFKTIFKVVKKENVNSNLEKKETYGG